MVWEKDIYPGLTVNCVNCGDREGTEYLHATTQPGRCRQVSAKTLADVGRCEENPWQVSAGVTKKLGRC